jgi:hypothetical protein
MFKKVVSISVKSLTTRLLPHNHQLTTHLQYTYCANIDSSAHRIAFYAYILHPTMHIITKKRQLAIAALPASPLYIRSNKKSQLILSWTAGFSQKYKSYSAAEAEETCASRINDLISDFGFLATGS